MKFPGEIGEISRNFHVFLVFYSLINLLTVYLPLSIGFKTLEKICCFHEAFSFHEELKYVCREW